MGHPESSSIHAEQRYDFVHPAKCFVDSLKKDIGHDILSISTPGSGVYPGNEVFSVGLARLLNEVPSLSLRHVNRHS